MTFDDINNVRLDDLIRMPIKWKALGSVFIFIVIGIIAWLWFISPQNSKYNVLHQQISVLKGKIRQKQVIAEELPVYQKQITEINDQFKNFLRQLPNRAQIPSLLDDVTLAGKTRNLKFLLFQPMNTVKGAFYVKIPVKIRVVGTYDELGRFTAAVAAMPRIVTLSHISLSPLPITGASLKDKALAKQQLQMSCIATTYRYTAGSAKEKQPKAVVKK